MLRFLRDLKEEIYKTLRKLCADERKPLDTDAQFLYKTRKKAFGPFKRKFWDLPADLRERLGQDLEKNFAFPVRTVERGADRGTGEEDRRPVPVIPPAPAALSEAMAKVVSTHG